MASSWERGRLARFSCGPEAHAPIKEAFGFVLGQLLRARQASVDLKRSMKSCRE